MGLSQSDRASTQEVQNTHDNVGAQQRGATDNLQHDAQQNSSKDVSGEKAYWSSQSQKGTANHLHDLTIDFGHEHPSDVNGKAGSPSRGESQGGGDGSGKTRGLSLNDKGGASRTKDGDKAVNEHTHTVAPDNSATDVTKNGDNTITKTSDPQGKIIGEERETSSGSRSGWRANSDGSTTRYNSPDKNHYSESTSKDDKLVSEKTTANTPEGQIKTDKKYDEKAIRLKLEPVPQDGEQFYQNRRWKGQ